MARVGMAVVVLLDVFASLGCKTSRDDSSKSNISFYKVPLVCPAAPAMGCGSVAKPLLLKLEQQPAVAEAWLNRPGTVVAIVWKGHASAADRSQTVRLIKTTGAKEMKDGAFAGEFASRKGWYRGADVDRLSEEEAEIIATRLVRRASMKAPIDTETAAKLRSELADIGKSRFLATNPPPLEESERLALQTAKRLLSEEQFAAFKQSLAAGLRPIEGEQ